MTGLLTPIENMRITQPFGPPASSVASLEPAMYFDGRRAWWQPFSGARFYPHFHCAIDIGAPEGTPIRASEDGVVTDSLFDRVYGGGHKVRVQIRPGVYYTSNHMKDRAVAVGKQITRGQLLGHVGCTGSCAGNHDHFQIEIDDEVGSAEWPVLVNPMDYFSGGARAGSALIEPIERHPYVTLLREGINVRGTPELSGSANIYATSHGQGIWRNGRRIGPIDYHFLFQRNITADGLRWAKVTGFGRTLYVPRHLVAFHKEDLP